MSNFFGSPNWNVVMILIAASLIVKNGFSLYEAFRLNQNDSIFLYILWIVIFVFILIRNIIAYRKPGKRSEGE